MGNFVRNACLYLVDLPDCDSLLENGRCGCLSVDHCAGYECAFYRPRGTQKRANARLCLLDEEQQEKIAQHYYKGKRPWLNDSDTEE